MTDWEEKQQQKKIYRDEKEGGKRINKLKDG